MKKFSILLFFILCINTAYSQDAELAQSPPFSAAIQKSSYLSSIPVYEWVESIQSFLEVSKKYLDIAIIPHISRAHILLPRLLVDNTRFLYEYACSFYPKGNYPRHLSWIVETPYQVHPHDCNNQFSLKMGKALYGLSLEKRIETRARISKKTKEVFYNLDQEKGNRIPHITHRTWITGTQNPSEPSQKRLEAYIQSLRKLSGTDWEHNFWCVDPNDIPKAIKTLKESGVPINIRKLEEIFPRMKAKYVFDAYYQDRQFCFASDIARHNIVYLYGGIYADLGTSFLRDLTPYADAYDYMFTAIIDAFVDCSFFGYKKGDLIAKEYLDVLDTLYNLCPQAKETTKTPRDKQGWHSPPFLMACIDQFSKPEDRFLFVPEGCSSLISIDHAGSWLGLEKAGNKTVFESQLDILLDPQSLKYR